MPPYKKSNKVHDIERPIASTIPGRDILGINANVQAISKTSIDTQDAELSLDYMNKRK